MGHDPYQKRVKDIMSKAVVTANEEDTLQDALTLLVENRLSTLPILDAREHCIGILSTSDVISIIRDLEDSLRDIGEVSVVSKQWLLEKLEDHDLGQRLVKDRMTTEVSFIHAEMTLVEAASEMLRQRVHHLPVLDQTKHLQGIVSTMDILRAFVEGAQGK